MAKTYVATVKYEIRIDFAIDGVVEKPDIIGAIFGQSEGLLGEDLDLRELQKNGKIGRIDLVPKGFGGKTTGTLIIPSSMDMVETSILAAAIETVDKVGPCNSKFITKKIEDTRTLKREQLVNRAKDLLQKMMTDEIPEAKQLAEEVRRKVRTAEVTLYGAEKLPAGPSIDDSSEVIVVEGRADVINLLKYNIKNVIGMGGSNIPRTIVNLSKKKTITLFVDGDRGGQLNIKKFQQIGDVDFIAVAPDGKEVEELQQKEIIMALRRKIPSTQGTGKTYESRNNFNRHERKFETRKPQNSFVKTATDKLKSFTKPVETKTEIKKKTTPTKSNTVSKEMKEFKPFLEELEGTLKAKFLDKKNKEITEVNVRDMLKTMKKEKNINAVVFDGIITKRLVEAAEQSKINFLVGVKKGRIKESEKIKILALEE